MAIKIAEIAKWQLLSQEFTFILKERWVTFKQTQVIISTWQNRTEKQTRLIYYASTNTRNTPCKPTERQHSQEFQDIFLKTSKQIRVHCSSCLRTQSDWHLTVQMNQCNWKKKRSKGSILVWISPQRVEAFLLFRLTSVGGGEQLYTQTRFLFIFVYIHGRGFHGREWYH